MDGRITPKRIIGYKWGGRIALRRPKGGWIDCSDEDLKTNGIHRAILRHRLGRHVPVPRAPHETRDPGWKKVFPVLRFQCEIIFNYLMPERSLPSQNRSSPF